VEKAESTQRWLHMDTTTLLIIAIIVLLLGGGWYGGGTLVLSNALQAAASNLGFVGTERTSV
jgi:hypothetical protein